MQLILESEMSKPTLTHKGYTGSCEMSVEDECLHGQILFIDDVITYEGQTMPELKSAFKEAVDDYLAYCKKTGKPANKPYSGTFNVRIGTEAHRKAAEVAHKLDMGLNEYVTKAVQELNERNGITAIEHIHNHVVTISDNSVSETRVATTQIPSMWETLNARPH